MTLAKVPRLPLKKKRSWGREDGSQPLQGPFSTGKEAGGEAEGRCLLWAFIPALYSDNAGSAGGWGGTRSACDT